jgi:hypothetical protein
MQLKHVPELMILEPRENGYYRLRELDCRRALETPVMTMLHGSGAPFFDFDSLLYAILPAATAVGWEEPEVHTALENIVRDFRPNPR